MLPVACLGALASLPFLRDTEKSSPRCLVSHNSWLKSVEGRDSFPTAGVELRARVTQSRGDRSGVNDQCAPEVAICCPQSWATAHNGPPTSGTPPLDTGLPAPGLSLPHPCRSPGSRLPPPPCPSCLSCGETGTFSPSPIVHPSPCSPCQGAFSRCPHQHPLRVLK